MSAYILSIWKFEVDSSRAAFFSMAMQTCMDVQFQHKGQTCKGTVTQIETAIDKKAVRYTVTVDGRHYAAIS